MAQYEHFQPSSMPTVDPLRIRKRSPVTREPAEQQVLSRTAARGTSAAQNDSTDEDDVPLARAIPTALRAQKSMRVESRSRAISTSGSRRPRLSEHVSGNTERRPSGVDPTAPLPDDLVRRLQTLQASSPVAGPSSPPPAYSPPLESHATSGGGLPRRTTTQRRPNQEQGSSRSARPSALEPPSSDVRRGRTSGEDTSFSAGSPPMATAFPSRSQRTQEPSAAASSSSQRPAMRARAMTLNAASSNSLPPNIPANNKSRPPSWIDFPEPDFSAPPKERRPSAPAPAPVPAPHEHRRQPSRSQTIARSRSRPPSPSGRHASKHGASPTYENFNIPPPPRSPRLPHPTIATLAPHHYQNQPVTPPQRHSNTTHPTEYAASPSAAGAATDMSFTNSSHPSANGTDIVNAKNNISNVPGVDHRIFIESKQKYVKVRVTAQTRAADVLARVSSMPGGLLRGPNSDERAIGGWMLYEVAVDFGMERPVREYELVVDVLGTWPAGAGATWNDTAAGGGVGGVGGVGADEEGGAGVGAQVNYLIIKRSGLRGALSMKHLPKSSPIHEGTVQHESKKGKWSKRSLKLREHSLFIAKKDGKDEVHLCSLSNFDGYYVTKPHRAPKNFVFAVRSTDNLNMFENPSDSVHIFSCEAAEGERWLEKILLARSYVLRQERTILFESPSSPAAPKPPHLNPFAIPPHQPTPSPVALQRKPSLGNVPSSSGMHVSRSQTQRRAAPPSRPSTSDGRPSYSGSHPNVAITAGRPSLGSRPSPGSGAGMTPASPARRMKPAGGPLITLDSTQWAEGSLLANWESKGGNPG